MTVIGRTNRPTNHMPSNRERLRNAILMEIASAWKGETIICTMDRSI